MADTKISAMTNASALGGTEQIAGVQSSANVNITPNQIKTFTSASPTLTAPALGTPVSGALTNCTGLPPAGVGTTTTGISFVTAMVRGVDFNATNTDNAVAIVLPTGFTRYLVASVRLSGASASLTTATCGLFTATGAGGTAIITTGTAITVNTASENTNANTQTFNINNGGTNSYTAATLYFRVQTPQGSAATGSVLVSYVPVS